MMALPAMAGPSCDALLDGVMQVMSRSFDPEYNEAWTRKQVADALALPSGHLIAVGPDGRPPADPQGMAGFALSRAAPGEEELLLVATDPSCRRRGLATQLLQRLAAEAHDRGAEKLFLEMRENNPARSLYERIGFFPIGRRKEYYRTRSGHKLDAITYALEIET